MLAHLVIGALAATAMWLLMGFSRRRRLHVAWWQWTLTAIGVAWAAFAAEIIVALVDEGSARAAAIVGGLAVGSAALWGLLVWRLVFRRRPSNDPSE